MNIDKMTKKEKQKALGMMAEEVVATYYHNSRMGANLSAEKYDPKKDISLGDGSKIEVKCQKRMYGPELFSIDKKHVSKCENVDELIFVEYYDFAWPDRAAMHPDSNFISIFRCKNQKNHFSLADQFANVDHRLFYDIKTNMIQIAKLNLPMLSFLFRSLTTAK